VILPFLPVLSLICARSGDLDTLRIMLRWHTAHPLEPVGSIG
jgi:hypothetical protein